MRLIRGTRPGDREPTRHSAPKTVLETSSSSHHAAKREGGSCSPGSRSVRTFCLTTIASVWGNQYMSTWCAAATISSYDASAASHVIGCSCASTTKSGSTWKVRVVRMPSAPSPTRATSRTSGFSSADACSTSPVPVTSSMPASWADRPAAVPPVPWVPVEVAPARVCSAMSPMLCSDRPSRSSARLRSFSGVPARAVTVIASRSTSTTPRIPSGRSSVCSGAAIAVNE